MARKLAGASLRALEFRTRRANRVPACERDFADSKTRSHNLLHERVNRRRHNHSRRPIRHRVSSVAMITAADIDPTAMNSPKFRLIAVQCVRPWPDPPERPARESRVGNERRSRRAARVLPASCVLRGRGHAPGTPSRAFSPPQAPVPPVTTRRISPRAREPGPARVPPSRRRHD